MKIECDGCEKECILSELNRDGEALLCDNCLQNVKGLDRPEAYLNTPGKIADPLEIFDKDKKIGELKAEGSWKTATPSTELTVEKVKRNTSKEKERNNRGFPYKKIQRGKDEKIKTKS